MSVGLYPEVVLCEHLSMPVQILPLPCFLPLLPHPLSAAFVFYPLPFIPLAQINLLSSENLALGVVSRYFSFHRHLSDDQKFNDI